MSKYPVPKAGVKESKIVVKVNLKKLLIVYHESDTSISIYIGGDNTYCAHVIIIKQTPSLTYANFSRLDYDMACDLDNNFKRGVDTNMIFNLMITIVKDYFPYISRIFINDASHRTCDNGLEVSLPELYYLTTGRTWYETRFGAYLEGADLTKFRIADAKFQEMKSKITWSTMRQRYLVNLSDDSLQSRYDSATTWHEFFGPIRNSMGVAKYCEFIAPWLSRFMATNMRFTFSTAKYYIDLDSVPLVHYSIESAHQTGGRKYTRTRIRRRRFTKSLRMRYINKRFIDNIYNG